jgi:hypothetical protein
MNILGTVDPGRPGDDLGSRMSGLPMQHINRLHGETSSPPWRGLNKF